MSDDCVLAYIIILHLHAHVAAVPRAFACHGLMRARHSVLLRGALAPVSEVVMVARLAGDA